MTADRSLSEILQDVFRNLQDVVRSEVRLARAEIRDDVSQAASSGTWLAAGAVGAVAASMFLLWTVAYALALWMSMWAATLVVGVVLALASSLLIMSGLRRLRRLTPVPERTVETVKEHLEWLKPSTK